MCWQVPRLQMLHQAEAVGGVPLKKGGHTIYVAGNIDSATQLVLR